MHRLVEKMRLIEAHFFRLKKSGKIINSIISLFIGITYSTTLKVFIRICIHRVTRVDVFKGVVVIDRKVETKGFVGYVMDSSF